MVRGLYSPCFSLRRKADVTYIDSRHAVHTLPYARRYLEGEFMAPQLLVDQPHANDELLTRQKPNLLLIDKVPHLTQYAGRKTAPRPNITHHNASHHVCGVRWVLEGRSFLLNRQDRSDLLLGGNMQAFVGSPDPFIPFARFLCNLNAPSFPIPFMVLVGVLVD